MDFDLVGDITGIETMAAGRGIRDYLFSADRFVAIEVPSAVKASLLRTLGNLGIW